jgi:hypothetical protein
MVDGQLGVRGERVRERAMVVDSPEHAHVQTLLQQMVGRTVREQAQRHSHVQETDA